MVQEAQDHYGISESAIAAIEAGCDVVLVCSDTEAAFAARDALAKRAVQDSAFAARLEDAARRHIEMRRACPPRPREGLELDAVGTKALEAEIAEAIARLR